MSRKVSGRERFGAADEFGGGDTWHFSRSLGLESLAMDEKKRRGRQPGVVSRKINC